MSDTEEIEIEVVKWTHNGKQYLLHKETGDVYDLKTQEFIGTYNKKTDEIEYEEGSEEEDEEEESLSKQAEKQMEQGRKLREQEEQLKKRQYDEDLLVKFENPKPSEYKMGIFGYKSARTNRVYTMDFKPFGMYDPKTRTIDTKKKPPPHFEEDEEDLDAMIDQLDKEIDELDWSLDPEED